MLERDALYTTASSCSVVTEKEGGAASAGTKAAARSQPQPIWAMGDSIHASLKYLYDAGAEAIAAPFAASRMEEAALPSAMDMLGASVDEEDDARSVKTEKCADDNEAIDEALPSQSTAVQGYSDGFFRCGDLSQTKSSDGHDIIIEECTSEDGGKDETRRDDNESRTKQEEIMKEIEKLAAIERRLKDQLGSRREELKVELGGLLGKDGARIGLLESLDTADDETSYWTEASDDDFVVAARYVRDRFVDLQKMMLGKV